jgi:hypothetical protein
MYPEVGVMCCGVMGDLHIPGVLKASNSPPVEDVCSFASDEAFAAFVDGETESSSSEYILSDWVV